VLAVPENFGVISLHSKWPFVELFFVVTNSFQPTFTGLSSFFFVIDQEITLVEGLGAPADWKSAIQQVGNLRYLA